MNKAIVSIVCSLAIAASASAQTLTTLSSFTDANGSRPLGSLTQAGGTLYGTTESGGTHGAGTVFSVPTAGGPISTLATFDVFNGCRPRAGLLLSRNTLYGTTWGLPSLPGSFLNKYGNVFSVPVTGGPPTTLASFGFENGAQPSAGLTLLGNTLYGTTSEGGDYEEGTVFSIPITGGPIKTLVSFSGLTGSLGSNPKGGLTASGDLLFGTSNNAVFSVNVRDGYSDSVAFFYRTNDGLEPLCDLILFGNTLYGTTSTGGAHNRGTVFSAPVTGGTITTLAAFNGANGANPHAGLVLSGKTLYGTTMSGGASGRGTVFSVPITGGPITTLVSFNGTNGESPQGGLTLSGNTLYGTTNGGGANGYGTVFALTLATTLASRPPVVILPGIAGSFVPEGATPEDVRTWLMTLGPKPSTMVLDPIALSYDDLVQSLESNGYVRGQTLYPVPYDWRLPLAPLDGVIDGRLNAVQADGVSDEVYETCVDYLGNALKKIQADYRTRTGQTLDSVDVVAHSMGGLVARAYIQSAAYGQTTSDGVRLPKIRNLITLGTPNRGASKSFNPWNNNWASDAAYRYVMSAFVGFADQKLFDGRSLFGPGSLVRTRSSFFASDSRLLSTDFEQLNFQRTYGAGVANLLPTYLVELGSDGTRTDILSEPANRNNQLVDLNGGATASASSAALTLDPGLRWRVIVGTDVPTPALFVRRNGWIPFVENPEEVFEYRDNLISRYQGRDETVTIDLVDPSTPNAGDGTVPVVSGESFFAGDARLLSTDARQNPFPAGKIQIIRFSGIEHQPLAANPAVQKRVLSELLGVPESAIDPAKISTSKARNSVESLWKFIGATSHDPISAVVVDGQGRRTGWSPETGRLSEIPGSVYFGGDDGFAWFFSPVSTPITVSARSLGQPYAFGLAIEQDGRRYSGSASGSLPTGAPILVPVTVDCSGSCSADYDRSGGTPDGTDIDAFFTDWLAGAQCADADSSSGTPDGTDISVFFTQWLAGGC